MRNLIEKHERSATDAPAQSTIDVLVAYTSSAKAAVRGADKRTSVDLALEAMFADTNRVFERSGIDTRLKLVHAAHVSYTQGANMVEDLCRLTARGETWGELRACKRAGVTRPEALDSLHKMRDRYEADLVTLIVGMNENRTAGIAWIAPDHEGFGFSVFSAEAELAGGYVFAHETGHNLGSRAQPGARNTRKRAPPARLRARTMQHRGKLAHRDELRRQRPPGVQSLREEHPGAPALLARRGGAQRNADRRRSHAQCGKADRGNHRDGDEESGATRLHTSCHSCPERKCRNRDCPDSCGSSTPRRAAGA